MVFDVTGDDSGQPQWSIESYGRSPGQRAACFFNKACLALFSFLRKTRYTSSIGFLFNNSKGCFF